MPTAKKDESTAQSADSLKAYRKPSASAYYEWYSVIQVTCTMNTRPDMKRKYMNTDKAQLKKPKLRTLTSEVCGGTNVQSKQAHVLQYKS